MSKRLILDAINGSLAGQTFSLPAHGSLLIGRLPECGVSISTDPTVSRHHCRIEFEPPECRLIHLSQTGPTFVNGVEVSRLDLRGGDEITLGEGNSFRVKFEDRNGALQASSSPVRGAASSGPLRFAKSAASCGWLLYRGVDAELSVGAMLSILDREPAARALVDFARLKQTPPEDVPKSRFLYPWWPPESRADLSPILMSSGTDENFSEIVKSGWEGDGIVCIGSTLSDDDLLAHWRKASGAEEDQPGTSQTVYHWPSLLNMMLSCQSAEQMSKLLSGVSWLLVHDPKSAGLWSLYGPEALTSTLTAAGLQPFDPVATQPPQARDAAH